MSSSFRIEQLLDLKNYLNPLSFILGHDLKQRTDKFFKYLELKIDSSVEFVMRVDLKSKFVRIATFGLAKYF